MTADQEVIEVREFTCPICKNKWQHHFFQFIDPFFLDCSRCGSIYVWVHEDQKLFDFEPPYTELDPGYFPKIS